MHTSKERLALYNTILQGDALQTLRTLPACSVQSCITSPPYFGLRDYGIYGQIGLEETPEAYTEKLVQVFREVRRVLRDDGVLWLNLGDSYASSGIGGTGYESLHTWNKDGHSRKLGEKSPQIRKGRAPTPEGLRPKNLLGIPWRVAFALQADGWILRSDCIWHKTNAMPESVKDRPTKAHEYLFLFAKNERYYYDSDSVKEESIYHEKRNGRVGAYQNKAIYSRGDGTTPTGQAIRDITMRNCRSVWSISTVPYKGAHFAVMPQKLVEPCVLASSRPNDIILDPFSGAGTVPLVALQNGRRYIGIELNPEYIKLAQERLSGVQLPIPLGGEEINGHHTETSGVFTA